MIKSGLTERKLAAVFIVTYTGAYIRDGNSEHGAHVRSKLCHLICLRRSISTEAVKNRIFFSEKT